MCERLGVTTVCAPEGEKNGIKKSTHQTNYQSIHHVPHTVSDMDPSEWMNILSFDAFELTHAAPHSVCWKELALANILRILTTRDTSQLDRSWLKDSASLNIAVMAVTRDTSHFDKS